MDIPITPNWFNTHGLKLVVSEFLENPCCRFVLSSTAARISVTPDFFGNSDGCCIAAGGWFVSWVLTYSRNEKVSGSVHMTSEMLGQAFGFTDGVDVLSRWLAERYGADAAYQGRFIRRGNFLNIPCPGTGHDGDPNISVFLTDEIRAAARKLLEDHANSSEHCSLKAA